MILYIWAHIYSTSCQPMACVCLVWSTRLLTYTKITFSLLSLCIYAAKYARRVFYCVGRITLPAYLLLPCLHTHPFSLSLSGSLFETRIRAERYELIFTTTRHNKEFDILAKRTRTPPKSKWERPGQNMMCAYVFDIKYVRCCTL